MVFYDKWLSLEKLAYLVKQSPEAALLCICKFPGTLSVCSAAPKKLGRVFPGFLSGIKLL